jgi:hypothetical protein
MQLAAEPARPSHSLPLAWRVVCAAHHLHGIHDGTIHASGTAPHAIEGRLGVRPGAPPFLSYVGDRRLSPEIAGSATTKEAAALPDRRAARYFTTTSVLTSSPSVTPCP